MSALNKWITAPDVVTKEDLGLAKENDRLRRETRILKEERGIQKATYYMAGDYAVICREGSSSRA